MLYINLEFLTKSQYFYNFHLDDYRHAVDTYSAGDSYCIPSLHFVADYFVARSLAMDCLSGCRHGVAHHIPDVADRPAIN